MALLAFAPLTSLADDFLPHRAQYSIALDQSKAAVLGEPRHIVDAPGVMQIELADVCEGWSSSQRLNVTLREAGGGGVVSDTVFASWEAKDGSSYRFESRITLNNYTSEQYSGQATLASKDGGGVAEYIFPKGNRIDLPPGALFPAGHLRLLLDSARRGERVVSRFVFDGATEEGMFEVNAIIGKPVIGGSSDETLPENIAGTRYWPIRLAFFPPGKETPQYETTMHLAENGVVRELIFDYTNFSIRAALRDFEVLDPSGC